MPCGSTGDAKTPLSPTAAAARPVTLPRGTRALAPALGAHAIPEAPATAHASAPIHAHRVSQRPRVVTCRCACTYEIHPIVVTAHASPTRGRCGDQAAGRGEAEPTGAAPGTQSIGDPRERVQRSPVRPMTPVPRAGFAEAHPARR